MGETEHLDLRGLSVADIEDKLREIRRLVIIGEPGSGKSTMLRYLTAVCAESGSNEPLLPLFLDLRHYADGQEVRIAKSAVEFAQNALQLEITEHFFDAALKDGRCLVCLDALDQVSNAEQRRKVVRQVEQLTRSYSSKNCFVVTSRRAGYDDAPLAETLFGRYALQPMDDDDIKAFLSWRFGEGSEQAQGVLDTINNDATLRALAANPLHLDMLSFVYDERMLAELPLKLTGFYQKVIENIGKKYAPDDGHSADLERRFAEIAHYLHSNRSEAIGRNALVRTVGRLLQNNGQTPMDPHDARREAEAFVELAERRTGLLVGQRTGTSAEFRFLHATFREYLAARHIYLNRYFDGPEAYWNEIQDHLSDVHWREVILFLLSGFEEDEEDYCTHLVQQILTAGDQITHHLNLMNLPTHLQLAADALANQAPISPKIQQEIVERLKTVGKAPASNKAINTLTAIKHLPNTIIPALTVIASDPTVRSRGRISAAKSLGHLGEMDTAVPILTAIATDPAVVGRQFALESLVDLGETDTAVKILATIATDPAVGPLPRTSAAESLGRLGETDTAIAVLTTIAADPTVDTLNRRYAATSLGRLGETDTAIAVLAAIATDTAVDTLNRRYAAASLGRLGEMDTAVEILTAIATDTAVYVGTRVDAVASLGHLGIIDTAIPWLAAIATDTAVDTGNRRSAAEALGSLGETDTAIETLTTIASDPAAYAGTREEAAASLWRWGVTDTAIATLTAVASDPAVDTGNRRSAASKLGGWGVTDTAIAALTGIATDATLDARNRVYAAQDLWRWGEMDTAIAALSGVATDPAVNPDLRRYAADRLGRCGESGIAKLKLIARDPDTAQIDCIHMVDALASIAREPRGLAGNGAAANAALHQLTQDKKVAADVRSRAGWQLGRLGDIQAAIAALTHVVNAPETPAMEKVRAAGAIQEFGGSTETLIAVMRAGIANAEIGIADRIPMAWRLSNLGEMDEGIATLVAIASDATVDDINRVRAAWYLSELDASESASPALTVLTAIAQNETAEPSRRFQAGKVLADLDATETAIAALTAVAHSRDANAEDRIKAANVLATLGDKTIAETVLSTVADDRSLSQANRRYARESLRALDKD